MKSIIFLLFILVLCTGANAAQFSLAKVDSVTYEAHVQTIREAIASDNSEPKNTLFYKNQSFLLKGDKGQHIGYFIPVNFDSRLYGKNVCRLYFFDFNGRYKYTELFSGQGESDEVVPHCVSIEAVSIQAVADDEANYLVILLHAFFSNYGHVGVVVNYKNGNIIYDKKLNDCIDAKGETGSIRALKKKMLSCR